MTTAALFLANGFEETEAVVTLDLLRRANIRTTLISVDNATRSRVVGAHNISLFADMPLQLINIRRANFDALILPGGMPGSDNLNKCTALKHLLVHYNRQGKLIAAICAAPFVLGELNLLQGRRATCYPGFEPRLLGATLSNDPIVTDANIITAKGPACVFDFALAIITYLQSPDSARQVANALLLP